MADEAPESKEPPKKKVWLKKKPAAVWGTEAPKTDDTKKDDWGSKDKTKNSWEGDGGNNDWKASQSAWGGAKTGNDSWKSTDKWAASKKKDNDWGTTETAESGAAEGDNDKSDWKKSSNSWGGDDKKNSWGGDKKASWGGKDNDWKSSKKRNTNDWAADGGDSAADGGGWKKNDWENKSWKEKKEDTNAWNNDTQENSNPSKKAKTDDTKTWKESVDENSEQAFNNQPPASSGVPSVAVAPAALGIPPAVLQQQVQRNPARLPTKAEEWADPAVVKRMFPDLPPLPRGWLRCCTKSTPHQMYYFNRETCETTFEFVDLLKSRKRRF
eukprot:GEMP01061495.1.p1 GENE.GEMP01061495.1~~GEMP01061495.1.p1  ORF type:complete len:326 (+),score=81.31 GEMP01061495.1:105-1082(+)